MAANGTDLRVAESRLGSAEIKGRSPQECAVYMVERYGKRALDTASEYAISARYDDRRHAEIYWLQVESLIRENAL